MLSLTKKKINHYLFFEFGFDIQPDSNESLISERYPFTLNDTNNPTIFTFIWECILYYVVTESGLNFFPADDFTVNDLELMKQGASWIGQREPVNLNTSRIGHSRVPSALERLVALKSLGQSYLGSSGFQILEGLFLVKTQTYLALIQPPNSDEAVALGTNLPARIIKHPHSSSHRRLSVAIGQALSEGIIV
jgi:hypothetical protein